MKTRKPSATRNTGARLASVLAGSFGLAVGAFILLTIIFVVARLDEPYEIMWKHMHASILIFTILCFPLASKLMTGHMLGAFRNPTKSDSKQGMNQQQNSERNQNK